jgi:hypothetical protein
VQFTVYDDIPDRLEKLRNDGLRLGVLTSGSRWTREVVERVLRDSHLDRLIDSTLTHHWAADSDAQFQAVAERTGVPSYFVSPDRSRRWLAKLGGFRVVPHPALVFPITQGAMVTAFLAEGIDLDTDQLAALCRQEPVAIPFRIVTRENRLQLYVIAAEFPSEHDVPTATSACRRFEAAGFTLKMFGDSERLDVQDFCFVQHPKGDPVDYAAFLAVGHEQTLIREDERSVILGIDRDPCTVDAGLLTCGEAGAYLQPQLSSLKQCIVPRVTPYVLTEGDKSEFQLLCEHLYWAYLTPWWAGISTPGSEPICSRHVLHPHNERAVKRAVSLFKGICGIADVRLCPFTFCHAVNGKCVNKTCHNVEATIPAAAGSPYEHEIVLLGAHLDSINKNGDPVSDSAPGLNDDASGIAGVLSAARVLTSLSKGRKPLRTIRFVLFNAEEAGKVGSRQYVGEPGNVRGLVAMFQLDMIGYVRSDLPSPQQCEVHSGVGNNLRDLKKRAHLQSQSSELARIFKQAAAEVSPSLEIQIYPIGPGCGDDASTDSDHAPFYGIACPACKISENFYHDRCEGDRRRDHPTYHNVADVVVNKTYAADVARAAAAAVWMRANATE